MSRIPRGRHSVVHVRDTGEDLLSAESLQREIEQNRRSEYRLVSVTAIALVVIGIMIFAHLVWL
ncbi:hypothetical protein SAMN04515671_3919 [Nakamurella panacisegetis]|uniref:Uncharacterized protein n=1 Tax=Nakamurella panacisegetis TaxID=1090615 RepID=A0A1H0S781_9ACTN|nr:hypothetical protein [Nakamurella panacisegetis]SDP37086.1 hypothetical protein SAMN04515671_3919 [Nakamurella panacisegetis]